MKRATPTRSIGRLLIVLTACAATLGLAVSPAAAEEGDKEDSPFFQRPGSERRDRPRPEQPEEQQTEREEVVRPQRPGPDGEIEQSTAQERVVRPEPSAGPGVAPPDYELAPVPDRWRIVENIGVNERLWDPYNQNTLKADRPIPGTQTWFVNLSAISDTVFEPRRLPTPVGAQATDKSGTLDVFGKGEQYAFSETLITSASLIQGDTVFRPPDWEFRITAAFNANYTEAEQVGVLNIDPTKGRTRTDWHVGIQELFVDRHLWNKSDRYDFDSLRVGIQPFISDFRGFLFQDQQPGVRLFGNFFGNRMQYNLAWFRRLEKDTNSGLNEVFTLREDDLFFANLYYQDFPVTGFQLQGTVAYEHNREGDKPSHYNENGFLERPAPIGQARGRDFDVVYLGLNGDGHWDRLNTTFSLYGAFGQDNTSPFTNESADIAAFFAALELSLDFDWFRPKVFTLYASGDPDPYDDEENGFDALFENPQFAGAETSFWQRQSIPFIGGGGVGLSGRNALLPALRTSKEEGQTNFVNPGLILVGVGADFDILPELRFTANASYLRFDETRVLRDLRVQGPIDEEIGWDLSGAFIIRPLLSNNIILRLSGAVLLPGEGLKDIYDDEDGPFYSVLANLVLSY